MDIDSVVILRRDKKFNISLRGIKVATVITPILDELSVDSAKEIVEALYNEIGYQWTIKAKHISVSMEPMAE